MNQTLSLMMDNIVAEKDAKEHGLLFARGLVEIKNILKDRDLTFTEDTDYKEIYEYVYNEMKSGNLIAELNPRGDSLDGHYSIRGENFTYCFWLYITSAIRAQNPKDANVWIQFGHSLHHYMYDVSSFLRHLVSNDANENKFPIAKLIADAEVFDNKEVQNILLHLMDADTFLEAVIKPSESESLYRILQRFNNIVRMPLESWVSLGHLFKKINLIHKSLGRKESYNVRQIRESMLFGGNTDETFKYINRYVHGMIAEVQQVAEDLEMSGNISGTVMAEFIILMEPRVQQIFDSNFKVSNISLPLDELQLKLLLLTQETLNETKYSYYDYGSFYNAHTIYSGQPDPEQELAFIFRKELHKELHLSAVGGYTAALERYGLILPI